MSIIRTCEKSHLPHLHQRPTPTPTQVLPVPPGGSAACSPPAVGVGGRTLWGQALSRGAHPLLTVCHCDGTAALLWGRDSQAHRQLGVSGEGRLGCVHCCQSQFSVRWARGWPTAGCLSRPIARGSRKQGRPREAVSAKAMWCWTWHPAVPARAACGKWGDLLCRAITWGPDADIP